jgi:VanZ family protein
VTILQAPRSRAELIRYWLPVGLWLVVVSLTSSSSAAGSRTLALLQWLVSVFHLPLSHAQINEIHFFIRKTGHFCNYAILSLLIFRAIRDGAISIWRHTWMFLALLGTLLVASADEVHQYFTPGREGTWHDVVLDMCGALTAQVIFLIWARRASTLGASGPEALVEKHEQA